MTIARVGSAKELLASTSLRPEERVALEAAIPRLLEELGDDLHAVWLYGSRARGEQGHDESDVDLMVITRGGDSRDWQRVWQIVFDAADEAEARPSFFSVQVHDPAWLEQRREIRSFFIQEVDRDKVVLAGSP